jgi:Arc/MetJ-type ribon-helix-helix transcriptional regulator
LQFVDSLIASGQFKNASEVFLAGLSLLEQSTAVDDQKLSLLRRLADEGFDEIDQGRGLELPTAKSLKSQHCQGRTSRCEKQRWLDVFFRLSSSRTSFRCSHGHIKGSLTRHSPPPRFTQAPLAPAGGARGARLVRRGDGSGVRGEVMQVTNQSPVPSNIASQHPHVTLATAVQLVRSHACRASLESRLPYGMGRGCIVPQGRRSR